jgi:hypothetical protein
MEYFLIGILALVVIVGLIVMIFGLFRDSAIHIAQYPFGCGVALTIIGLIMIGVIILLMHGKG